MILFNCDSPISTTNKRVTSCSDVMCTGAFASLMHHVSVSDVTSLLVDAIEND
jgi:hypothetical protein